MSIAPRFIRACLPVLCLSLPLAGFLNADESVTAPSIPTIEQQLIVEGQPVEVTIAPVYGDKDWAFTARWDDNNTNHFNMQAAMADNGLRGTFYLNGDWGDYGEAFAQKLSEKGCSIGGHTCHHYFLPTLTANALFYEIFFNRIQREADTDTTLNSFAFPYGRYQDAAEPAAMERITDAWLRSGYHHNVYEIFILKNPHMPAGYASTGNQVVPGDRKIDADKFRQQMGKILDNPEPYRAKAPAISLGVHAWQSPEEMEKFKELLSEYAGRDDFWYTNQTEMAAYFFQAAHTEITPEPGQPGQYAVTRPVPGIAGGDIPLTVRLSGPEPEAVSLDGEPLDITPGKDPGTWLVDLPYPPYLHAPWKIDYVTQGPGFEGHGHTAAKFPDVEATLNPKPDGGWHLEISNQGQAPLTDIFVTVRLPLMYKKGVYRINMGTLAPQSSSVANIPAVPLNDDPALRDGQLFAAAEIDFTQNGDACRLYTVYLGETDEQPLDGSRDAVASAGPFAPDAVGPAQWLALSEPDATLTPLNDSPLGQWRTPTDEQRPLFARDRVLVFGGNGDWRKAAAEFSRQPSRFAAVGELSLPEAASLKIFSGKPVVFAAVDGEEIDPR